MSHYLRLIPLFLFLVSSPVIADNACGGVAQTEQDFYAFCTNIGPQESTVFGSCTLGIETVPACCIAGSAPWLTYCGTPRHFTGFGGTCSDDQERDFQNDSGNGLPDKVCDYGCESEIQYETCVDVQGNQTCTGRGKQNGEKCTPGPQAPEPEEEGTEPPFEPDPENADCDGDFCWYQGQGSGGGSSGGGGNPPPADDPPEVCGAHSSGETNCVPPNGGANCKEGDQSAVCVGASSPSGAQFEGQGPNSTAQQHHTNSSGNTQTFQFTGYSANDGEVDPDGNGECPPNSAPNVSNTCSCVPGFVENGSGACVEPPEPCDPATEECDDGDQRTSSLPANCSSLPSCSGDEIDCDSLIATWAGYCAVAGTKPPPDDGDIGLEDALSYNPYSTGDARRETVDATVFDGVDGWLGGGACPVIEPISTPWGPLDMGSPWCELPWMGSIIMLIAYLVAFRIAWG